MLLLRTFPLKSSFKREKTALVRKKIAPCLAVFSFVLIHIAFLHLFYCCFQHFLPKLVWASHFAEHNINAWNGNFDPSFFELQSANNHTCVCSQCTKWAPNMHFFPPTNSHKRVNTFHLFIFFHENEKFNKIGPHIVDHMRSNLNLNLFVCHLEILIALSLLQFCFVGHIQVEFRSKQNKSKLHHKSIKSQTFSNATH